MNVPKYSLLHLQKSANIMAQTQIYNSKTYSLLKFPAKQLGLLL